MRISYILLGALSGLPVVLADRGSAPRQPYSSTCNTDPDSPDPATSPKRDLLASEREASPTIPDVLVSREHARDLGPLVKRQGTVRYATSCNGAPPSGSKYNANNGFPTMQTVLQAAYNDAVAIAQSVLTGGPAVTVNTKGFSHYFGGQKADVQLQHFIKMMTGVTEAANHYTIQFECSNVPNCAQAMSAMVTDSSPGSASTQKIIQVCPRFWTSASTRFLIFRQGQTTPSPPFRANTNAVNQWCRKTTVGTDSNVSFRIAQFYATAGHTVLHELTHLDSLGSFVGLTADGIGSHGTDDFQRDCELLGARSFLGNYTAGGTSGTSPDYNAESYAAAATEIYFSNLCGFSQIKPFTS